MELHSKSSQIKAAIEASAKLVIASAISSADPLEIVRNNYHAIAPLAGEFEHVHTIENHFIENSGNRIPVRIYNPSGGSNLPAVIFFHGGWFIGGGLETHDRPLRVLANASECIVVSVDYRLAPEHPFPAAIEDGLSVLRWITSQGAQFGIDGNRLAIAGDSAGGAIAAVIARKSAITNGPKISLQVLIYPVTDSSLQTVSWNEFGDGPVITLDVARQAWQLYVPNIVDRENEDASPIFAKNLEGGPDALIIIGECDPLRDEGIAYASLLEQSGIIVKTSLYKEMPHGFFQMGAYIDDGRKAIQEVADAIKKSLKN